MQPQDKLPGLPDLELMDDLDLITKEAARRRAAVLAADKGLGPGPVYQGVGKAIRRATATGKYSHLDATVDADEHAGTIAALRATARSVDRMTGHNLTGWHANGRDLAPLLEQLRLLLAVLVGEQDSDDLLSWLDDDDAPKEGTADERSTAGAHPTK